MYSVEMIGFMMAIRRIEPLIRALLKGFVQLLYD